MYTIRVTGRPIINGHRVTLQSNPVEVTLAAPPPRVALQTTNRVLSFKIQTDRPVYTAGEPVLVRLVITNLGKEPVAYDLNSPQPPCTLTIVNARNEPVLSPQGGHGRGPGRGVMGMSRLAVGTTTLGWSQIGAWGFFHPLEPDPYTITCLPEIYGYIFTPSATYTLTGDNATAAPALKVQILTKEAARTEPAYKLDDPSLDATFRSLMREYERLRSGVRGFVTQLQSGARQGDIFSKNPNWESNQEELGRRINRLPSSGNPDSPYVLLTANLQRAVSELGTAGESALHWCDPPSAGADLRVADYFFDAVRRELSVGETNAGDAAYPPSDASPRGYCR